MKISKKWLSQYMDVSDLSMEEIADLITRAGFEVEEILPISSGTNLVIGEVLTCENHPDSDHLHVTTVNTGEEVLQIVCGAPNVAAGQKVIVAKPGARLPGGEIKAGSIRGQESNGMICALFELGVDKHMLSQAQLDGIEILPEDAPVGYTDPLGYLGMDDVVLDVSLTPNRADCMSVFNMAKEIGAILNRPAVLPEFDGAAQAGNDTDTALTIVSETKNCPLFYGKVIGSVTIKESPKWMKELLQASGMHSINNVVDISNIVMLETGQPMHFYDIDAIKGQEITVKDGFQEGYTALDGVEYQLLPEDIVITNQGKPIGIGGVMGGDDSKIEDTTRGLIIECAQFDQVQIRNTARRLALNTESSQRYAKGVEPFAAKKALDRAVQLLIEYADAKDIEKTVCFGSENYTAKTITCTLDDINRRLGTDFTLEEVTDVLNRLRFEPQSEGTTLTVTVPSTRMDVEGSADLSEEVIRMIGYDRLPSTLPLMEMTEGKLDPAQKLTRFTRQFLCENGLQDCVTYTLVSDAKQEQAVLSLGEAIAIDPPLSEERKLIRTSILPSLLESAAFNKARSAKDVNLFEISDLTSKTAHGRHLAIVLEGNLESTRWLGYEKPADFFTIKGLVESYLERQGINPSRIRMEKNDQSLDLFHPGRSAKVLMGKQVIGIIGEIHPKAAKELGLKGAVLAELDLNAVLDAKKAKVKFAPVSKFPSVSRDLALTVARDLPSEKIVATIKRAGKLGKEAVIKDVEIFDVYTGSHVAENEKSVALNLVLQSDKQTLNMEEINSVMESVLKAVEKDCKALIRS